MAYDFKRSDLLSTYDWKAKDEGDNPKIVGFPDSHFLNRSEGYEVLPFIIRFVEGHTWSIPTTGQSVTPAVKEGQNVERMIHYCPAGKHSHAYFKQWILDNWKTYIK